MISLQSIFIDFFVSVGKVCAEVKKKLFLQPLAYRVCDEGQLYLACSS